MVPAFGEVVVASVYLETSSGMGEFNTRLLADIGTALAPTRWPLVVMGDWNNEPEVMGALGFGHQLGVTLLKPNVFAGGTFKRSGGGFSTLDFGWASASLAQGVKSFEVASEGTYNLHRPVRLAFHPALHKLQTLTWRRLPAFPKGVFSGPCRDRAA